MPQDYVLSKNTSMVRDFESFKVMAKYRLTMYLGKQFDQDNVVYEQTATEYRSRGYRIGELAGARPAQEADLFSDSLLSGDTYLSNDRVALPKMPVRPDVKPQYSLDQVLGATDAAIKLANAAGIDLKDIKGTGKGGNIRKGDVQSCIDSTQSTARMPIDDNPLFVPERKAEGTTEHVGE